MTPVFLDANVPMYAAGPPHPLKDPCARVLDLARRNPDAFLTDAEVLQEILHRYLALRAWPAGRRALQLFVQVMQDRIVALLPEDVLRAAAIADGDPRVAARDLLHVAVMERAGCGEIVSADRDFDRFPAVRRLDPAQVAHWGARFGG
jgi:predicted nucleic acid-binding protein